VDLRSKLPERRLRLGGLRRKFKSSAARIGQNGELDKKKSLRLRLALRTKPSPFGRKTPRFGRGRGPIGTREKLDRKKAICGKNE